VLAYGLADRTLLKTGAAVVTIAMKQLDGGLLTSRVTVEKETQPQYAGKWTWSQPGQGNRGTSSDRHRADG
jgi:hypothetical protein